MKKLFLFVLCLINVLLLVTGVYAEEKIVSGDYEIIVQEDGTAKITDYKGMDEVLTVPAEISGYRITSIGLWAFNGSNNITSLILQEGLTSIGECAFFGCRNLTSVSIPQSTTSIDMGAFGDCVNLEKIIVSPDNPTFATIDNVLFNKETKSLIAFPAAKQTSEYIVPQGITSIEGCAFLNCKNLKSITLPESLTSIGQEAFEDCTNLEEINLPEGLTSIEYGTFIGCKNLTSINLPEGLTSIEEDAFWNCENLTSINLPDSLTSIGENAFDGCEDITFIVNRESNTREWVIDNGYNYTYPDANNWLNN